MVTQQHLGIYCVCVGFVVVLRKDVWTSFLQKAREIIIYFHSRSKIRVIYLI